MTAERGTNTYDNHEPTRHNIKSLPILINGRAVVSIQLNIYIYMYTGGPPKK